ncbi:MAG: hypothetical protein OD918_06535 [Gammaproteobacteria bacterium]
MSRKEDIATYVLYQLGGANGVVHIEEIAKKCHELAQPQFSWQLEKYKDYPDIKIVYYALDFVSRDKGGKLARKISDRSKGGQRYQLTQAGAQWIKKNGGRLAAQLGVSGGDQTNAAREVQESLRSLKARDNAFKRYKKDGENIELSIYELIDFLGCPLETSPTVVRKKFAEMQMKAESAEDAEIDGFLAVAESKFSRLLLV